ncbi:MAG: DUF3152 domain-containing protein [Nocardioides sp.]
MGLSRRVPGRLRATLVVLVAVAASLGGMPSPARAADPPVNADPPVITGDPVFRELLQVSDGSWTPEGLTLTYAWARDGVEIAGETGASLRLGLDDLGHAITATVTATDADQLATLVTTDPVGPVRRATLTLEAPPEVTGLSRYTRLLTATPGSWSRKPTSIRYRWLRDGEPIRRATAATYRLAVADVGHRVRVRVTVRREGYRKARALSPRRLVRHLVPVRRSVTYSVATRGRITADLGVFKKQVQQTFADPRGWRSAGVELRRVASGGSFTVVLAQASTVPSFSSGCSAQWSCRVGRYVIINQTRWLTASPSWHAHHLPLRGYRHMVVNHETGHWLGHGHVYCAGAGRLAPVMQQQSKSLQGCRHNSWPLPRERWFRSSVKRGWSDLADRASVQVE